MLALIAGTGDLPPALVARLDPRPLICGLAGSLPQMAPDIIFRIETLGSLLDTLHDSGVTAVCMAGAIARPQIEPKAIDAATRPLLPVLTRALTQGDDGALRAVIAVFETAGFDVRAAHDIAPDLMPAAGVPTTVQPTVRHDDDATAGQACIAALGHADIGQACIVRAGQIAATESADGTDAMLARYLAANATRDEAGDPLTAAVDLIGDALGGVADWLSGPDRPGVAGAAILFKAPKPGQDRRADLPVIGPGTALNAADAGLSGIVIEAGGVMVLDLPRVVQVLDARQMFLWVRPRT